MLRIVNLEEIERALLEVDALPLPRRLRTALSHGRCFNVETHDGRERLFAAIMRARQALDEAQSLTDSVAKTYRRRRACRSSCTSTSSTQK